MVDFLIDLLTNFVWAIIGVIAIYIYRTFSQTMPTKRLWRLKNPDSLTICVATTYSYDTGNAIISVTGLGQLRSLPIVISSLRRAYKVDVKKVVFSDDYIGHDIEGDLISLGGPDHNKITRQLIDSIKHLNIVGSKNNQITWMVSSHKKQFTPEYDGNVVVRDYGLIISMNNPYSRSNNKVCILGGTHTYGVIAAARYYTENFYDDFVKWKNPDENFAIVVSCDVADGWPVGIKCEERASFVFDQGQIKKKVKVK